MTTEEMLEAGRAAISQAAARARELEADYRDASDRAPARRRDYLNRAIGAQTVAEGLELMAGTPPSATADEVALFMAIDAQAEAEEEAIRLAVQVSDLELGRDGFEARLTIRLDGLIDNLTERLERVLAGNARLEDALRTERAHTASLETAQLRGALDAQGSENESSRLRARVEELEEILQKWVKGGRREALEETNRVIG